MVTVCAACGRRFETKSRRARFCSSTCRSRGHRGQLVVVEPAAEPSDSPLVVSTRAALAEAGRADSPLGLVALELAVRMGRAQESGSGVAALARELRTTLAEAVAGAHVAADPVDELRRRRDAKRAGSA